MSSWRGAAPLLLLDAWACGAALPQKPLDCIAPRTIASVASALADADEPCRPWVRSNFGRAARSGFASGALWSRKTPSGGVGLFVSAAHTLGEGQFGASGVDVPQSLTDPSQLLPNGAVQALMRVRWPTDAGLLAPALSPLFPFFNPAMPAAETQNQLRAILPRHDFFVGAVDGQVFPLESTLPAQPLGSTELTVFDPDHRTTQPQTVADAVPRSQLLVVGVPVSQTLADQLVFSVGRVLSDEAAVSTITELAALGDEEGSLPYDAAAEFLVEGFAEPGMSGSGLFDANGAQVGILVRGTDVHDGKQYLRAVRMRFVLDRLHDSFINLSAAQRERVAPYLERGF